MKETLSRDLARFKAVVETYGARVESWPKADLHMMKRLLSSSDVARSLLRQETKFDQLLSDESKPIVAPSGLMGRVLMNAEDINQGSFLKSLWPFGSIWQPAAGMAMAACIGILLGFTSPNILENSDEFALNDPSFSGATISDLESEYENL
ncbi:MAG: hypothetical protein CMN56_15885 [Sneathiella sp.]|uniref:hypothetical protein n=1 Tax=Sneathiella sp. TaxID=1964365 RepID=UPI000C3FFF79|nr:hypothetical protein [Sneathiella sp.]MAZ04615.1 hypothetical protein [Sneathiella sp.]|tara:strand:+ start:1079 stop:1531 length:453 start_codon:yes stop_codon:yes gene_type:complete